MFMEKKYLKNGNLLVRIDSAPKVSAFWAFERPPAGVRDHYAGSFDGPFTRLRKLAVRHGKSATNQLGK